MKEIQFNGGSLRATRALGLSLLLTLGALGAVAPAGADWWDCAYGASGNIGSVWCGYACEYGQTWQVRVDAANSFGKVRAKTDCGGTVGACGYSSTQWDACFGNTGTVGSHSHSGNCFGEQYDGNYNGLSVQCLKISGGGPSGGLLDEIHPACVGDLCLAERVVALGARAPVGGLSAAPTAIHLIMMEDSVFGFACTHDDSECIPVIPTCRIDAESRACWI